MRRAKVGVVDAAVNAITGRHVGESTHEWGERASRRMYGPRAGADVDAHLDALRALTADIALACGRYYLAQPGVMQRAMDSLEQDAKWMKAAKTPGEMEAANTKFWRKQVATALEN